MSNSMPSALRKPIPFAGFNRIVINEEGEALAPNRAINDLCISPHIAFMRNDGWVLGAPIELEAVAYRMWADQWTHFCTFGETEFQPICLYSN